MPTEQNSQLIIELNQILKYTASCDISQIHEQGDNIRNVFFIMLEKNFTPKEIEKVFEGVEISDERMNLIEQNDLGQSR